MLAEIDAVQFGEWLAYHRLEPWGEERADLRAGIVASTLANIHRAKGAPALTPFDFMPYTAKPARQITEAEIERKIDNFMRRYH